MDERVAEIAAAVVVAKAAGYCSADERVVDWEARGRRCPMTVEDGVHFGGHECVVVVPFEALSRARR